jgi:hypothetical protein
MSEKKFDIRFVLLSVLINGGAVFYINLSEGGAGGAGISGIVQLFVSGRLAGFTVPYAVRKASLPNVVMAYFYSSLVTATFVATVGWLIHYIFLTPDLAGTVIWNFCVNAFSFAGIVWLKRNISRLPPRLRSITEKL